MSLNDKKSQLFGKGTSSSSSTAPSNNNAKKPVISAAVTQSITMLKPSNPGMGLSNTVTPEQKNIMLK